MSCHMAQIVMCMSCFRVNHTSRISVRWGLMLNVPSPPSWRTVLYLASVTVTATCLTYRNGGKTNGWWKYDWRRKPSGSVSLVTFESSFCQYCSRKHRLVRLLCVHSRRGWFSPHSWHNVFLYAAQLNVGACNKDLSFYFSHWYMDSYFFLSNRVHWCVPRKKEL